MPDKKPAINQDWNLKALQQYSGFEIHPYEAYQVTPFSFVFITRPSLFIKSSSGNDSQVDKIAYSNMASHPYLSRFTEANQHNKKDGVLVDLLSYKPSGQNENMNSVSFIPIITNKIKNFSVEGNQLGIADQAVTRHGYRHIYPTNNVASLANGVLNLEFLEMKDSEISNLFGIWYNTIVGLVNGELRANPDSVKRNRVDYTSSLYYFKVDRDGQTIRYWSKYNGIFPINNPSEAFGHQDGQISLTNMNINLTYDSREELTLSVLDDFNNASLGRVNTIDDKVSGFTMDMFSKEKVLSKAEEEQRVDNVPLIYIEDTSTDQTDIKRRFVLRLGSNSVYKSARELMMDTIEGEENRVGTFSNRENMYGHKKDE